MKKYFALVLTLVMLMTLFPAGMTANAENAPDAPFYCVNFNPPPEELSNVYNMPFFWIRKPTMETEWPYTTCYGVDTDEELAEELKKDFDSRPEGTRYVYLVLLGSAIRGKIENHVYYDKSNDFCSAWVDAFLEIYKGIGGKLEGFVVDLEYNATQAYYLGKAYDEGDTSIYTDIVNDPRYATDIRPRLAELGFDFSMEGTEKTELWSTKTTNGNKDYNAKNAGIWNLVALQMQREAINESILYPMLKHYPDATLSDYQSGTFDTWNKTNGPTGGLITNYNIVGAGNLANFNTYHGRPHDPFFGTEESPKYDGPIGYNKAVYEPTAFNMARYDTNLFKNMYASTDDGMIDAWIAHYSYGLEEDYISGYYSCTPYYTEMIYHLGLLNPQVFLGYITSKYTAKTGTTVKESLKTVNDILVELTRLAGYSDRKPIQTPATLNGSYILSGIYANGRNIWRLTPDTDVVSLKGFKVEGTDPTFKIDGLTITFPGGKIIEDGDVYEAGSCGYWIETAKNVEPVITAEADRYSNYPALEETFDGYQVGTAFTSAAALPKRCWKVDGTATVQANGTGKALALTGNTTVENTQLPKNITAGDEYAKQQAWEVTITLPSGLSETAEIKLLSCAEGDGGIKISGGKVFYDEAGSYKQLDGVLLSADTYTFRREVDFRTDGSFTSDYAVYDSTGAPLEEVKDVAMNAFTLPVTTIAMGTTSANEAVLIDDYKLYPTGVTTIFELYDADLGNMLTDINAIRTQDTAYRMSWMNAGTESMVAYVYDAQTNIVVKAIEMAPGMDGVITGVVELEAGEQVQLAVKTMKGTLPPPATPDPGDGDGDGDGDGMQATVPPDTQATVPSGNGDGDAPSDSGNADTPSGSGNATQSTQKGDSTGTGDTDKEGLGAGMIVLIVVLSLLILGGGGFAAYWFVVKPKLAAKAAEELPQETAEIASEAAAEAEVETEAKAETEAETEPEPETEE